MTEAEQRRLPFIRATGSTIYSLYKGILYFLSLLPPVLVLQHWRHLPAPALLALSIAGFGFAGLLFHLLLVLTKLIFIGHVHATGTFTIHTREGKQWFAAAMLSVVQYNSPFRSMNSGLSFIASWYFRGMGAKMPDSALLGVGTVIFDPWFLEVGENASIGAEAMVLGHIGHGKEFILGRVIIGEDALIGSRAVIFPDVRIGKDARIAAGAVVTRGTIIPDGETWGGVPARRLRVGTQMEEQKSA